MSTQPVSQVTVLPAFQTMVQSEVSALAHKHITLSYAILAVLVIALAVGCLGGYMGLRGYERALARAEAAEQRFEQKDQQYQQMFTAFQQQIAKDSADREAASQQQAKLEAQIASRANQPLPTVVQTGLKPDATAQEAGNALGAVFTKPDAPVVPMATPDGKVQISAKEAQEVASLGIDGQRAEADLKDEIALYTIETTKTISLSKDLQACTDTLAVSKDDLKEAKVTIADYKKVAKRSKWQKIWQGFKTYGLPVLAYAAGRGKL